MLKVATSEEKHKGMAGEPPGKGGDGSMFGPLGGGHVGALG